MNQPTPPDCCIFCESEDLSAEHFVADWVLRAFHRSRDTSNAIGGRFVGASELRIESGKPVSTAAVVCRHCNNTWMSQLDEAASRILKPVVRGEQDTLELGSADQSVIAAWAFKSVLVFDATQGKQSMATLRAPFAENVQAPPGCLVLLGPPSKAPLEIPDIPEVAGLAMFGVREFKGVANVNATIHTANEPPKTMRSRLPTPGYMVMLGRAQIHVSGLRAPVIKPGTQGFVQVWPAREETVTFTSTHPYSSS